MEKKNRYLASIENIDMNKMWDFVVAIFCRPIIEIAHGISSKSIDWFVCLVPGCVFNVLILTGLDALLFRLIKLDWMLPPSRPIPFMIYSVVGLTSGFSVWGLWQTLLHNRVSRKLTEVFQTSGLKNSIGKLPSFVFDKPLDEFTRKMRLTRANLPVSQFISAKENLESALQVYIDEIKEDRERGTVDIIYAGSAIPTEFKLDDIKRIGLNKILVGKTRARDIFADLNEIPHFLIGGQSGGGKSTYLRQLITTLYLNNPLFEFVLIDLKEGLEFQLFEKLKRVKVISSATRATDYLNKYERELKARMEILKKSECKDLHAYAEKSVDIRKDIEEKLNKGKPLSRVVIVVDEAAELYMKGDKTKSAQAQQAKSKTVKLAAQGRAVGIHLIIATQRPDVKAIDSQIKANLSGMLAFQMPNHASSMTILDSTRAAHLPKIPGRAIWKTGMETVEVQAPFLSTDDANELLKPYRIEGEQKDDLNEENEVESETE